MNDLYDRVPQRVRAFQYDGTNRDDAVKFLGSPHFMVEARLSTWGRFRGVIEVLAVSTVNQAVIVPIGDWLLLEDHEISSMTDTEFHKTYTPAKEEDNA